jgi:hypothetical protein
MILCTTENGWIWDNQLYKSKIRENNAKLGIVLADYNHGSINLLDNPKSCFGANEIPLLNGESEPRKFPWWLHNKHFAIFCKINENGTLGNFHEGIYYTRRLLSNVVNPIYINERVDFLKIFNFFTNYWYRSGLYSSEKSESGLISETALYDSQKDLLIKMYTSLYDAKNLENDNRILQRLLSDFRI